MLFEAPTNPMLQVPDLEAIVGLAKQHDVVTVLDNTFAGLHNHGRYGIDFFVHSLTKYANGHGDVMGGVVIGDKKRIRAIKPLATNMGSTLDPGAAFMVLRGLKTYYLRYRAALCQRARDRAATSALAKRWRGSFYPGLAERCGARARAQADERFRRRADVRSRTRTKEQTWAFIDALELFVTTASLGSTDSLVSPVKLFLGSDLSAEEQARAQIKESTVRFAVGIEHVDDLIADIDQALLKTFG